MTLFQQPSNFSRNLKESKVFHMTKYRGQQVNWTRTQFEVDLDKSVHEETTYQFVLWVTNVESPSISDEHDKDFLIGALNEIQIHGGSCNRAGT